LPWPPSAVPPQSANPPALESAAPSPKAPEPKPVATIAIKAPTVDEASKPAATPSALPAQPSNLPAPASAELAPAAQSPQPVANVKAPAVDPISKAAATPSTVSPQPPNARVLASAEPAPMTPTSKPVATITVKASTIDDATKAPAAPPARPLGSDEIATLLKQGNDFVAVGDFASARTLFERIAEAGDARGALAYAETYDPIALARIGAKGATPDVAKARDWYGKARDMGATEANARLTALAARTE